MKHIQSLIIVAILLLPVNLFADDFKPFSNDNSFNNGTLPGVKIQGPKSEYTFKGELPVMQKKVNNSALERKNININNDGYAHYTNGQQTAHEGNRPQYIDNEWAKPKNMQSVTIGATNNAVFNTPQNTTTLVNATNGMTLNSAPTMSQMRVATVSEPFATTESDASTNGTNTDINFTGGETPIAPIGSPNIFIMIFIAAIYIAYKQRKTKKEAN